MPDESPKSDPAPASNRRRFWLRRLAYLPLFYAVYCAVLYSYQDKLIFPADLAPPTLPKPPRPETVVLQRPIAPDQNVVAWFIPAPAASPDSPAPLVIYFHGNAEIIDYQRSVIDRYHRLGISVLLPEYRGYGHSAGVPSQTAIREDNIYFYEKITQRADVDPARVVFHGRSLGGGIAADLAAHRTPDALILQSTFASLVAMTHRYLAPGLLLKHPFRTDRVVAELDAPILLFHGTHDGIIPVRNGRRLSKILPTAPYLEFNCGHNDLPPPADAPRYWQQIKTFLTHAAVLSPAATTAAPG